MKQEIAALERVGIDDETYGTLVRIKIASCDLWNIWAPRYARTPNKMVTPIRVSVCMKALQEIDLDKEKKCRHQP